MKVYFTASIAGKKYYLNNYLKIIDILKSKRFEVISDHIINADQSQVRQEAKSARLKFQAQLDKWINSCDFMIAEVSFPSISVGFEISLALNRAKPVLILYSEGHPPTLLAHHKDEKLACEKYDNNTLKEIIGDFINYVEGSDDTRFTFFISNEMMNYLNKVSLRHKIPKSVYLRRLIEQDMPKNR